MAETRGTVVFDLDGTLADTAADLIGAANAAFRGRGLPDLLHPRDDAPHAFAGGRAMLRAGHVRLRAGDLHSGHRPSASSMCVSPPGAR